MNFLHDYLISPTHQWWVDNIWAPSRTLFVSAVSGIPAAAVVVGQTVSSFANDTTINSYLAQMSVPNWVPMGLATISLIYYVAHGRGQ